MNTKTIKATLGLLLAGALFFTGCANRHRGTAGAQDSIPSYLKSPTPDNNSYTNPSSADTNYPDSPRKHRDTVSGRPSDSMHE